MRPVVVQVAEISVDGIICEEGTEFEKFCRSVGDDQAQEDWFIESLSRAGVHIVGRVTYEAMARHFPVATAGEHQRERTTAAIGDLMNRIPKAVFSRTLETADWLPVTILRGDTAAEIAALKQQGSGEILAHGGAKFLQSLASLDLADVYRLNVVPYVAGTGTPLFTSASQSRALELVSSIAFTSGMLTHTYRRRR